MISVIILSKILIISPFEQHFHALIYLNNVDTYYLCEMHFDGQILSLIHRNQGIENCFWLKSGPRVVVSTYVCLRFLKEIKLFIQIACRKDSNCLLPHSSQSKWILYEQMCKALAYLVRNSRNCIHWNV